MPIHRKNKNILVVLFCSLLLVVSFQNCKKSDNSASNLLNDTSAEEIIDSEVQEETSSELPATPPSQEPEYSKLENIESIFGGGFQTCALTLDGTAKCWGTKSQRNLDPVLNHRALVRPLVEYTDLGQEFVATGIAEVYGTDLLTCVRYLTGKVSCFGPNSSKLELLDNMDNIFSLQVSGSRACLINSDRKVYCYVSNGVSGLDGRHYRQVQVAGIEQAKSLSVGYSDACAVTEDGSVKCWNYLELESTRIENLDDVRSVYVSGHYKCAIYGNQGSVKCWGENRSGVLGRPSVELSNSALPIDIPVLYAKSLALGSDHACALYWNGTVACWGTNFDGQLGRTVSSDEYTGFPGSLVPTTILSNVQSISGGEMHTCALLFDRTVKCWGDVSFLGNRIVFDHGNPEHTPVHVIEEE